MFANYCTLHKCIMHMSNHSCKKGTLTFNFDSLLTKFLNISIFIILDSTANDDVSM